MSLWHLNWSVLSSIHELRLQFRTFCHSVNCNSKWHVSPAEDDSPTHCKGVCVFVICTKRMICTLHVLEADVCFQKLLVCFTFTFFTASETKYPRPWPERMYLLGQILCVFISGKPPKKSPPPGFLKNRCLCADSLTGWADGFLWSLFVLFSLLWVIDETHVPPNTKSPRQQVLRKLIWSCLICRPTARCWLFSLYKIPFVGSAVIYCHIDMESKPMQLLFWDSCYPCSAHDDMCMTSVSTDLYGIWLTLCKASFAYLVQYLLIWSLRELSKWSVDPLPARCSAYAAVEHPELLQDLHGHLMADVERDGVSEYLSWAKWQTMAKPGLVEGRPLFELFELFFCFGNIPGLFSKCQRRRSTEKSTTTSHHWDEAPRKQRLHGNIYIYIHIHTYIYIYILYTYIYIYIYTHSGLCMHDIYQAWMITSAIWHHLIGQIMINSNSSWLNARVCCYDPVNWRCWQPIASLGGPHIAWSLIFPPRIHHLIHP